MENLPINVDNGSRLASLIEQRLRGDQRLFLVSIGSADPAESAERRRACTEFLGSLAEMRRNVAASGIGEADLGKEIDEAITEVRVGRK